MRKSSLKLISQVKSIIAEYDVALTLRQIYYRLVASQIIPNRQKYYIKLSRLCVKARDEGLLPERLILMMTYAYYPSNETLICLLVLHKQRQ